MDERIQFDEALTVDPAYTEGALTAILFAAGDPVETSRLAAVVGIDEDTVNDALIRAADRLAYARAGLRLMRLDDRWQFVTAPEYASVVRRALDQRKAPRLSQTALEVLTIIAYRQPVTRGYIEAVRGVDSGYTVNMLEERGFIEVAGRLDAPGRPMLYRTTPVFLRVFGIASLEELPPLPEDMPLPPVQESGVVEE
ncbi:MAG: SMC-Scp complex subunit ScpB [Ruminococcaceae bacterium]|nr:SMC-Scp complex subunit ScpB [Oscillospiraceae bacterium]